MKALTYGIQRALADFAAVEKAGLNRSFRATLQRTQQLDIKPIRYLSRGSKYLAILKFLTNHSGTWIKLGQPASTVDKRSNNIVGLVKLAVHKSKRRSSSSKEIEIPASLE